MNTYRAVINDLKDLGLISELYRFQGGKSFDSFDIKKNKFSSNVTGKYVYFSITPAHHQYFTIRRLRQLINNLILINTPYSICNKQLSDLSSFFEINNFIANSNKLNSIYSIKIIHDSSFSALLKENSFYQNKKMNIPSIERVDRRVYNGGYGISSEWLSLLEHLTLFNAYQKIDAEKISELIHNMKKSGRINSIHNINFLFQDYTYQINPDVFNDFNKYEIMNLLECIIDKKICHPDSALAENPNNYIRQVITGYQEKREKTLRLIDNRYNEIIEQ